MSYKSIYVDNTTMVNFIDDTYANLYSTEATRAGRYLVVKLRGSVPEGGSLPFCVSTEDNGLRESGNPIQTQIGTLNIDTMPSDWTVMVIDLQNVQGYSAGTDQRVTFSTSYGDWGAASTGVQLDLAYAILVSDLDDIKEFVTESSVRVYANGNISEEYSVVSTENTNQCIKHARGVVYNDADGVRTFSIVCPTCGYVYMDNLNWYESYENMGYFNAKTADIMYEDGVYFRRLTYVLNPSISNAGYLNLTGGINTDVLPTSYKVDSGRYLVVKMRGHANFYIGATTVDGKNNINGAAQGKMYTDEWSIYVLDMPASSPNSYDADMISAIKCRFYPYEGDQIDIAYAAFVDTVQEAGKLVSVLEGGDSFLYREKWSDADTECNLYGLAISKSLSNQHVHDYINPYQVSKSISSDKSYVQLTGQGKNHSAMLYEKWNSSLNANEYTPLNIGASKYLVLNAMASDDNLDLKVNIGINGLSTKNITLETTSEFNTFVIDLEKLFGNIRTEEANQVTRLGFSASCKTNVATDFTSSDYLRISGVYFCATWDQVKDYVAEDEAYLYLGTTGGKINVETRKCVGTCTWAKASDGNNLVTRCAACATVSYDYKVDTTAAARFLNFADTVTWGTTYNSYTRTKMVEEGSPEFLRYTNANGLVWGDQHAFDGLSKTNPGQYLVLKVRLGANGNGQTYVQCYFSSKASTASWDKGGVAFKVTEDNEWHTVVINLAERITTGAFAPNADGTYNVDYMYTRFYGDVVNKWDSDDYFDIAYVAVCDSLEDVSKLAGSDTYEYSVSTTESIVKDSKTHQPIAE